MKLRDLLDIPECGIYALIHEKSKRIFLYYTNNMSNHFIRNLDNIKYGRVRDGHLKRYRKDYRFEVIEKLELPTTHLQRIVQRHGLRDLEKKYTAIGYKVTIPSNTPKFRFHTLLSSGNACIFLKLINKNNDSFVIGVFDNKAECDSYIAYLGYPHFIFCTNTISKLYFATQN